MTIFFSVQLGKQTTVRGQYSKFADVGINLSRAHDCTSSRNGISHTDSHFAHYDVYRFRCENMRIARNRSGFSYGKYDFLT